MSKPIIRLGDKTTHGGTVIEASPTTACLGIPVARVGDRVSCPKKGHGSPPIISGDGSYLVDGKPVAREGDTTGCGAVLIASQQHSAD